MAPTTNQHILDWIDRCVKLCRPEQVVWIDGSEEQLEALRQEAFATGELIQLNQEKMPGCVLHRSDPRDVARVESRTFICCEKQENAGPTNNWCDPREMKERLRGIYDGCMAGRTMYVIPYSMSIVGSPFAKYGIELTDSIYVVVSMAIMTRVGLDVYKALGDSADYIRGLHSKAELDPEKRYIVHFPEENYIMTVNSGYGGNVLLGKKCFALRIASNLAREEGWLAEHMLILGIQSPHGQVDYVCAAFPSACGKTNLAMLIPPEYYRRNGWKCWTVGDDIAWLRPGPDGRLWAVNPENGFFGVAPGTSIKSNPNALECTRKNTIFTNVALKDDGTVWWEGMDKEPPAHLIDWQGNDWTPDCGRLAAHPNSRFTAPAENCPSLSAAFYEPQGVPISAIIFGGRRRKTLPLVYESRSWAHGVFVGSIMGSSKTAAAEGEVGELRRDPMAMLPFCGYHMADYWQHWLDMEKLLKNPPKIYNVNWFRTNDAEEFLWPGFGENIRVLEWILRRANNLIEADDSLVGCVPRPSDINITGISEEVSLADLKELMSIEKIMWVNELRWIEKFYRTLDKIPQPLLDCLEDLKARLETMED